MRVKWELQHHGKNGRGDSWNVYLVDGDNGVHEKMIDRIGSIENRFLTVNVRCTREFHQGLFWMNASGKLDRLGLSPLERQAIEAQISAKVPRPGNEWALWGVTCIPRYDSIKKS
jgi:hypothetical protein